jgi:dihydrofolate synthase/folylpolyglutamate synthase
MMITYPDSVQYLYSLGNEVKTIKLGLDRIRALLDALEYPERAFRSIHVAGTNGKGSTCAMIEAGLRAAGHRTGLYTSPHLVEPTERIQVGGEAVTREEFTRAFEIVHGVARKLLDEGTIDAHPTYFETVTAMAFWLFRERAVERALIEVGLGGRLDATNVVSPELCVITPVDYDHESWLGTSLAAIAGEKAGILKRGVTAVIASQHPEGLSRIVGTAHEVGASLRHSSEWQVCGVEVHSRGSRFLAVGARFQLPIECNLAGAHQVENARTAIAALDLLGVEESAIVSGVRDARWPGRLETIGESPEIILDGAHNPAGIRALAAHIERFYSNRRVWLIYSTMRDKSVGEIGEMLSSVADEIIVTSADSPRSLRPEALVSMFPNVPVRSAARLAQALEIVRNEAAPEDAIFITGSLFLVGEARALLVR